MALCGHSEPWLEAWPAWGMAAGGAVFELPTPAPLTDASASSSSPNLPTPVADNSRGLPQPGTDYASLPNVAVSLLPTPTSRDHKGRNQRNDATCLPGALLTSAPTPPPSDAGNTC